MYGKVFSQMYDGTLATKGPWQALVTFQQMIVLCDRTGIVDMTAEAISRRTTVPLDVIQIGIAALEAPDPASRTPGSDGRRIVRLRDHTDWGWQLVNFEYYRGLRSAEERREYHREYKKMTRASGQSVDSVDSQQLSTPVNNVTHAEAEAKKPPTPLPAAPAGLRDEVWDSWLKYRGKQKPETVHLQARRLTAWSAAGLDPNEIVERSIANGWKGLFPPDKAPVAGRATNARVVL